MNRNHSTPRPLLISSGCRLSAAVLCLGTCDYSNSAEYEPYRTDPNRPSERHPQKIEKFRVSWSEQGTNHAQAKFDLGFKPEDQRQFGLPGPMSLVTVRTDPGGPFIIVDEQPKGLVGDSLTWTFRRTTARGSSFRSLLDRRFAAAGGNRRPPTAAGRIPGFERYRKHSCLSLRRVQDGASPGFSLRMA
jgi:hypothetical protein